MCGAWRAWIRPDAAAISYASCAISRSRSHEPRSSIRERRASSSSLGRLGAGTERQPLRLEVGILYRHGKELRVDLLEHLPGAEKLLEELHLLADLALGDEPDKLLQVAIDRGELLLASSAARQTIPRRCTARTELFSAPTAAWRLTRIAATSWLFSTTVRYAGVGGLATRTRTATSRPSATTASATISPVRARGLAVHSSRELLPDPTPTWPG